MFNASRMLSGAERGVLNQIAMFSVTGLSTSMAMVFVGGLRVVFPWF